MIYQAGDYEAVHKNPVWRDKANFIVAAHLEEKEGRSEWEQLWALRLDERRFLLCCIPFFAYDLSLGDEVETDANYVVQRVLKASGRYTFRVWFGDSAYSQIKDEVLRQMEARSIEFEWSSDNLLAISSSANNAQEVADYLHAEEDAGHLIYETGRSV
jgi:hypothetical protein